MILFLAALAMPVAWAADCDGCWCVPFNDTADGTCPDWRPKSNYSDDDIAALAAQTALNPMTLDCNPYEDADCATSPPQTLTDVADAVCGFTYADADCGSYTMTSFVDAAAAAAAGAFVSHAGACGVCSTTQDLAVYLRYPDLTSAGKVCAAKALLSEAWGTRCYEALGFTEPCARIWNYDGAYDGQHCKWTCLRLLDAPNNGPPPQCALNDCLQCDEDEARHHRPRPKPSRTCRDRRRRPRRSGDVKERTSGGRGGRGTCKRERLASEARAGIAATRLH